MSIFDPRVPNNDLPPIPSASVLETPRTLKRAIDANRELASLRASGDLIPSQFTLLRAILLQEARASSEIENIVTTNDELYRALGENPDSTDPQTREVLRYGDALWHGYEDFMSGRPLRPSLLVELAQIIKAAEIGVRNTPGCQIVNDRTGEVVYTPPEGKERVLSLLNGLCAVLNDDRDSTDPLIKMAAAHYQFEAIHPFPDGNGRTGRVLNILYLLHAGRLDLPLLYLSGFVVRNKPRYYQLLRAVTAEASSKAWEEWILFMLDAVQSTAAQTLGLLRTVKHVMESAAQQARQQMARGYSKELIELIFSQPYTRISLLEQRGIAKRNTASVYLRELERIGLLRSVKVGREILFLNHRLMEALTPAE
jgi:Fic family protein